MQTVKVDVTAKAECPRTQGSGCHSRARSAAHRTKADDTLIGNTAPGCCDVCMNIAAAPPTMTVPRRSPLRIAGLPERLNSCRERQSDGSWLLTSDDLPGLELTGPWTRTSHCWSRPTTTEENGDTASVETKAHGDVSTRPSMTTTSTTAPPATMSLTAARVTTSSRVATATISSSSAAATARTHLGRRRYGYRPFRTDLPRRNAGLPRRSQGVSGMGGCRVQGHVRVQDPEPTVDEPSRSSRFLSMARTSSVAPSSSTWRRRLPPPRTGTTVEDTALTTARSPPPMPTATRSPTRSKRARISEP